MTFSKKNHSTPLHSTHSTELFKIFFSLLTLSTAFLQKASGPGKNNSHVDHRLYESKLKKNLLKELLNYKTQTYTELDEEKILELYNKLVYKLSVINTF